MASGSKNAIPGRSASDDPPADRTASEQPSAEPPENAPADHAAIAALLGVLRAARVLAPARGATSGAQALLVALAESGQTRPSRLAADLHLDLSTVSRHLTSLERRGLVRRSADPADRRARLVELTDAGQERVGRTAEHRVAALAPVLQRWTAAERHALVDLLHRLAGDLKAHVPGPRPDRAEES